MCILNEKIDDEEGGWLYHGQTEWIENDQNPKFSVALEMPFPTPSTLLRFTIIDVDDKNNIPTSYDPKSGIADLLGIALIDGSKLIAAAEAKSSIVLELSETSTKKKQSTLTINVETVHDTERSCLIFQSRTAGCHVGRMHALLFSSERIRNLWAANMKRAIQRAERDKAMVNGVLLSWQTPVKNFYNNEYVQRKLFLSHRLVIGTTLFHCYRSMAVVSGALVLALFITDALSAEWGATGAVDAIFYKINCAFTAIFTIELLINLYGNWFKAFAFDIWVSIS